MNIAETNGIVVASKGVAKDKVFDKAEDKNVARVKVYLNSTDSKLYYDAAYTNEVDTDDLENLFMKGVVCVSEEGIAAAVYYSGSGIVWGTAGQ